MGVSVREKQKGSGDFYVFVRHQGERSSQRIGSQEDAEAVAQAVRAEMARGTFDLAGMKVTAKKEEKESVPTLDEYYKRFQGPRAQLLFVHNEQIVADFRRAPEWFLAHPGAAYGGQDRPFDPRIGLGRVGYRLDWVFPAYGPSGWTWALYHQL